MRSCKPSVRGRPRCGATMRRAGLISVLTGQSWELELKDVRGARSVYLRPGVESEICRALGRAIAGVRELLNEGRFWTADCGQREGAFAERGPPQPIATSDPRAHESAHRVGDAVGRERKHRKQAPHEAGRLPAVPG